jgi:hypothetical protein
MRGSSIGLAAACVVLLAACDNRFAPFDGGDQTGDLSLLGESCSCTFYPDDSEIQIICSYYGETTSRRNIIAWVGTSPRRHEAAIASTWMWIDEPDEGCDYYGSGVAESWVGATETDPSGTTTTPHVPIHIRRWVVPEQEMCQGDGITCFDYDECIDWQESTADDVSAWCKVSYF